MAETANSKTNTRSDWEAWERRRATNERKYRPLVFKTLQQTVSSFTDELRQYGFQIAFRKLDFHLSYNPLYKVLLRLYLEAGIRESRVIRREQARIKKLNDDLTFIERIKQYFRLFLLNKSVIPILDTTKDKVREIMNRGLNEGWGTEETARKIIEETTEWNRRRSRMIVRTETVRSANWSKLEQAKKSKFETAKIWFTARDERVRGNPSGRYPANSPGKPNHWKLHGTELGLNAEYENGCEFPGDPNAPAKEVINCRCTLIFKTKRDRNGNPILKRTPTPNILSNITEGILRGITIGSLIDSILNE